MDINKQIQDSIYQIKDSLGLGSKVIVGVDIGFSAIKLAYIKSKGVKGDSYKLESFISVPLPEGSIHDGGIQNEEEVLQAITHGLKSLGVAGGSLCVGIGGQNVVLKRLQLPGGKPDEIEEQVGWEIEQFLPFDVDEATLSFQVIRENEGGGVDVLAAVANNELVENITELFSQTDWRIKIIDLNVLALVNILECVLGDKFNKKNASVLALDIGAQKTHFIIYRAGTVLFSKEIPMGGVTISDEIQRKLSVNYADAEDLKIFGDDEGNLPEEILDIIDQNLDDLFAEIKKTYDFYTTSTTDSTVQEVYITGGSALLPGLIEGLGEVLDLTVNLFNPFTGIDFDENDFNQQELEQIASTGAVALGLGLRKLTK